MDPFIYFSLSFVYGILLVLGIMSATKNRWSIWSIFLLFIIAALVYDNTVLCIGRYIGKGNLLESLNALRYWMHSIITPLLIPFVWQSLKDTEVRWAKTRVASFLVFFITSAIIIIDTIPLLHLSLQPEWQLGVLSYDRVNGSGSPVMMVAISLAIIITSIVLWIKQGWKWLFIGLVLMGVVGALSIPFESNAIGNIAELTLIVALYLTQNFQDKQKHNKHL